MIRGVAVAAWAAVLVACGVTEESAARELRSVDRDALQLLAPDIRFGEVLDIVVDSSAVWVLETSAPFVTRVPADGSLPVQFGVEGQGPGELMSPIAMQPSAGGGVHVWDVGNRQALTFDGAGRLVDSRALSDGLAVQRLSLRDITYAAPFRIRTHGDEFARAHFPERVTHTADMVGGWLLDVDLTLGGQEPIVPFADFAAPRPAAGPVELVAVPLWDACQGAVVLWNPSSRQLVWLDGEGALRDSVSVPIPAADLALGDVERYLRRMARLEIGPGYEQAGIDFAQMARADREQFPEQAPSVTDVRCESRGTAWVRLFGTEQDALGRGQRWWRISGDGHVEPYQFTAQYVPFAFSERSVYGLVAEADGSQRLALWAGTRSDSW